MRKILFRGKDIKGNWHIGLLAHIDNAWYISNKAGIATAFEVIPQTIGQYTGLKDKNNKKIFEGDIVKVYGGEYCQGYWEYLKTITVNSMTDFDVVAELTHAEFIEVIGNIYDNPELLIDCKSETVTKPNNSSIFDKHITITKEGAQNLLNANEVSASDLKNADMNKITDTNELVEWIKG